MSGNEDGHIIIGTELDTKEFDSQITYIEKQMEEIEDKLKKADMGFEVGDTIKLEAQYEKLSNRLSELIKKKQELNKTDFSKMQKEIGKVGDSVSSVITKMGKWALAVFGIRSAYMFVRQAMSTLSQYNEQMATNVEYIRYLLASTLQPVIETLIQLAYKLLTYINFIAKAWFGVDLFANASADAFNRNKKALGGATKSAKELKKTLAGFDEMNILQDNGSTSAGGGGGGISLPTLPSFEDVEIPGWIQWIADNGELIAAILGGIAAALVAIHLGASLIMGLGIGVAVVGLITLIQGVIDYLNDPTWDNFGKVLIGLGLTIAGIAIAFGAWPVAVAGAVVAVIGIIVKYWEQIKAFFQKGIDWLSGKSDWIREKFGSTIGAIYDTFVRNLQLILNRFDTTFKNMKTIFDNLIGFIKNVFTGNWKGAFENLKNIAVTIFNQIKNTFVTIFKGIVNFALMALESAINWPINKINGLTSALNNIPGVNIGKIPTVKLPRLAKGGILNMPGRGVDYYGANIAEKGAEAVIPFTDEQVMDRLGQAIARHTVVNLTNINQMNGRVISRELQRVQNNQDFAFNR